MIFFLFLYYLLVHHHHGHDKVVVMMFLNVMVFHWHLLWQVQGCLQVIEDILLYYHVHNIQEFSKNDHHPIDTNNKNSHSIVNFSRSTDNIAQMNIHKIIAANQISIICFTIFQFHQLSIQHMSLTFHFNRLLTIGW